MNQLKQRRNFRDARFFQRLARDRLHFRLRVVSRIGAARLLRPRLAPAAALTAMPRLTAASAAKIVFRLFLHDLYLRSAFHLTRQRLIVLLAHVIVEKLL